MNAPFTVSDAVLNSALMKNPRHPEREAAFLADSAGALTQTWSHDANRHMRRAQSVFGRRRPQRSPDRAKSRERRRVLGGSPAMPPNIRCHFTEGERAVLAIVAGEVKRQGLCDLPLDKIAALAGVGRTTAQNALAWASRLCLISMQHRPMRGRKSLTNVVRIVAPSWLTWL